MSDGYAQKNYVSKELSRLNDTLTREINEVKFSMAQMDDCCLRQDASEVVPTQAILPQYLFEDKFSSIDEKIRNLSERVNSRKGFAQLLNPHRKKTKSKFLGDQLRLSRQEPQPLTRTHFWKTTAA